MTRQQAQVMGLSFFTWNRWRCFAVALFAASALASAVADETPFSTADREYWAFQPVRDPEVPSIADEGWAQNEIDHFVLRKLRAEGLAPSPRAEKRARIRRAYFDLWGLPPTPEEVEAFVADDSPGAWTRLIDRLLESPRYGERWARHWLDVVRYAESDGYKADGYRPNAWRYRDYVIQSFNADKPYDRFVMEQLAGDEVAPDDPEARVATSFLRLGIYEYNQRDVANQWKEIINDITDVTADVFLGVGLQCARCHDHKFDPFLQKDYFKLRAFFAPLLPRNDLAVVTPEEWLAHATEQREWERETSNLRRQIEEILRPYKEDAARGAIAKFPEEIQAMIRKPVQERTPTEHQLAELAYRQVFFEYERIEGKIKKEDRERLEQLRDELSELDHLRPKPLPKADLVTDLGLHAPPTFIPKRERAGPVEPGFLTILDEAPAEIRPPAAAPCSTGRRTALAQWIADPTNPLSTRVIVNRVWQGHFGKGIVSTASDFGRLGDPPSHPELLDWLTCRFLESGWSLKALHRLIMASATYHQSAATPPPETARLKDPDNQWLWRMNARRLEAEEIRDAMLHVSGELDITPGGPSVSPSTPRRAIYTRWMRNSPDPMLAMFDAPDGYTSMAERPATTTPTQSLLMINGEWTFQRAAAWAQRLRNEAGSDPAEQVVRAYQTALGRSPAPSEKAAAVSFLRAQEEVVKLEAPPKDEKPPDAAARHTPAAPASQPIVNRAAEAALVDLCHALLNSNEFLYVD